MIKLLFVVCLARLAFCSTSNVLGSNKAHKLHCTENPSDCANTTDHDIVGYIHICQKDGWQRSFDLIMSSVRSSGLYNVTREIRLNIVNDHKRILPDVRFQDVKFTVVLVGPSELFERPTLLKMRQDAFSEESYYW